MNPSERETTCPWITRLVRWGFVAGVVFAVGWCWWISQYDSRVPFLPKAGPADWIIYPKSADTTPHQMVSLATVFRRTWTLPAAPADARLSVRVFKEGEVRINGRALSEIQLRARDWKKIRTADITKWLHAGDNEILVTVTNSLGPPALWLEINANTSILASDIKWQASFAGAIWQPAIAASAPPIIRPGNYLSGRELVAHSLIKVWPILVFLLLLAVALVTGATRLLPPRKWFDWQKAPVMVLVLILLSWGALFANNLPQIAPLLGFDRDGHLQYIDYILKNGSLPLADQGWQMYQPPLFYALSAIVAIPFGNSASGDAAILALRALSAVTGMGLVAAVFLCLRLMFADQPGRQIFGLLIAGYLPANVCLSHHITNEILSALCLTLTLYFTLRVLRSEAPSRGLLLAVGLFLGLSLLTKFSTLLAIPFIVGVVAWRPASAHRFSAAGRAAGWVALTALLVCGWHFVRVWAHFGTPLIGNWDPRLPFAWWQDPGYHTAGWYITFGNALTCPLFSSINGFADGIYTSLWGDGLCSGSTIMSFRPQWNYDLMNAAYLLALPATILVFGGLLITLARLLRRPAPESFLVAGLTLAFGAGIALMSLSVPSYAQVKAFYGLPAIFPVCALAVIGCDSLTRIARRLRPALWVWLGAWVMTIYGAFWIRSNQPFTYTVRGVGFASENRFSDAAEEFTRALKFDPNSLKGRIGLASALSDLGRREEAQDIAAATLAQYPEDGQALIKAGLIASVNGHHDRAIEPLRRGITLQPDDPIAYGQFALSLARLGRPGEAREVCVQGLRVDPFSADLHQKLGAVFGELGDLTNAVSQLRLALLLDPGSASAQSTLAMALASLGELDESAGLYQRAVEARPNDPSLRYQFAVALTMQGNARGAVEQYYQLLTLQPDNVEALNNLAWMFAVNASDTVRNGAEAVRLAERACELTARQQPVLLGTLAAAYAEAGRYNDAIATAEKARDLAATIGQKDVAEKNTQLLDLYRAGKPLREPDVKKR